MDGFGRPLDALDRFTLNTGASKSNFHWGGIKCPLNGGTRLIQVAVSTGLTVPIHVYIPGCKQVI